MNSIRTIIFIDNIRPIENWIGLLQILELSAISSHTIVVGNVSNDYIKYIQSGVEIVRNARFSDLNKADIIFGLPQKYYYLKIINIVLKKSIYINIGPGKITKAIGVFKHPNKSLINKITGYVKYLLPHNYYVCQDFDDAAYLATAYGRNIGFYLPIGLPKCLHIALELKHKTKNKVGLLFVPTHRWEGQISIIGEWLSDEIFVHHLTQQFDVYYNNHPDEDDDNVINDVIRTRKMPFSFWKYIDILVTDYSSIAHDYIAAGGRAVINITSDLSSFEMKQGKSPLPYDKQFPGQICTTKDELLSLLADIDSNIESLNATDYSDEWVEQIMKVFPDYSNE